MQLKKIAIVFLVVIMMFSLAAIGIAAEEAGSELSLSVKAESDSALANTPLYIRSGDVIKYVVSVDSNPGALAQLEIRATFDSDALTFQKATYGSIFNMDKVVATPIDASSTNARELVQVWVMAQDASDRSNNTGVFVTLEFKVSDSFDGKIDTKKFNISYTAYSVGNGDLKYCSLAAPEAHAHHYGEAVKTSGDCNTPASNVYQCTSAGCTDAKLSVPVGDTGDHVWGELIPAIAPTANKDGVVAHKKCAICGACCDANGKLLSSIVDANRPDSDNTVVTVVIIVVAVIVVVAGAVVALRVLKKKKIL